MKKYKSLFYPLWIMLIIVSGSRHAKAQLVGTWSGTVTSHVRYDGITGWSELWINTTFKDNNGYGTIKSEGELIVAGKKIGGTASCHGQDVAELHKVYYAADNTYIIYVIGPQCSKGPDPNSNSQYDIEIADEPIPANPKHLQGTRKTVKKLDPDLGTATITLTWDLIMSVDVELIVTPEGKNRSGASQNYDSWLPEPGIDETTVGSVMNISLKLQGKNGKPLSLKANAFELRLSNTSKEPGITINYPISPRARQLPDLSFMPQAGAKLLEDSQFIKIACPRCVTANVKIGSYDGGGWTTLTATAILEDSTRIEGELIKPGGERNIRIPKRDPSSIIATSWLAANGNPGQMKDEEKSNGNENNGDGLTAYEEYRGVISFGQFQRLDPIKKELGFLIKRPEIAFFSGGISKFQSATQIVPVYFDRYEIPDNRRLNQNAKTAHDFDQFVLRLGKGNTSVRDNYGFIMNSWGVTYPHFGIPARVTHIVIDVDKIHAWYQGMAAAFGAATLPFSEQDLLTSTTAHEIGHGVNVEHHGLALPNVPDLKAMPGSVPKIRIYVNNAEVTTRPYDITGRIGSPGNHESGNVFCFMCYRNKTSWVRIIGNNEFIFYKVPFLRAGTIFCTDQSGTDINAGNNYFGNTPVKGNCLDKIKLR